MPAIAEEESIVQLSLNRSHRRRIGDLLHPERESQAALDELKATMGSMGVRGAVSAGAVANRRQSNKVALVQVL
jgi:hypothetical protein